MRVQLIVFLIFFLFSGCTNTKKELNIQKVDEIIIKDKQPFVGELYNIKFIDEGNFYTYDNRNNVKKFTDYQSSGVVGKTGQGPCEHGSLNNFAVYQDSVFMIDREQSKYLAYEIARDSTDNCKEINDDVLVRLSGIEIIDGQPFFIRSSLVKSMDPNTPIIHTFDRQGMKVIPTNITLQNLDIKLVGIPMRLSMATDKRGKYIYFYLPLTKKVFIYDTREDKLKAINVDVYIAEDENVYETQDFQKFGDLVSNEIEVVFDLFALEQGVALGYRKGTGENQVWGLKIFDEEGEKISEKVFDNRVVFMENGKLMALNLNINKRQNPYSLEVYEYSFE